MPPEVNLGYASVIGVSNESPLFTECRRFFLAEAQEFKRVRLTAIRINANPTEPLTHG
jgi:hypothetical protein